MVCLKKSISVPLKFGLLIRPASPDHWVKLTTKLIVL